MEEKRYGVKAYLITELRRFQSNLKRKSRTMPFQENANTFVNDSSVVIPSIVIANEGMLSVLPSRFFSTPIRPPKQVLVELGEIGVKIQLDPGVNITIIFNEPEHKIRFITAMGDLNVSSSDESEENN